MTVAVMTALAAAAAASLSNATDEVKIEQTAATLQRVAAAIDSFDSDVSNNQHVMPWHLSQLSIQITTSDSMGCKQHARYTGAQPGNWTSNGPFGGDYFSTGGLETPLGPINQAPSGTADSLASRRATQGLPYFIQISSVDVRLARMLDLYVDGAINRAAGLVWYTTTASDSTVLLSYLVTPPKSSYC